MNGNFFILSQVNNCEARRKRAVSDPPPTITFSAVQNSSGIHDNDNGLLFRSFKFVFFYFLFKALNKNYFNSSHENKALSYCQCIYSRVMTYKRQKHYRPKGMIQWCGKIKHLKVNLPPPLTITKRGQQHFCDFLNTRKLKMGL